MASPQTLARAFLILRKNWPDHAVDDGTLGLYEKCLADVPDDVLEAATLECVSRCTFWPRVAELRKACFDLMTGQSQLPSSYEAWGEVRKAVSYPPGRWQWSNEFIPRALDCIGGMNNYRMSEVEHEPSWRARFFEAYDALVARSRRELDMLPQVKQLAERMSMALAPSRATQPQLEAGNAQTAEH